MTEPASPLSTPTPAAPPAASPGSTPASSSKPEPTPPSPTSGGPTTPTSTGPAVGAGSPGASAPCTSRPIAPQPRPASDPPPPSLPQVRVLPPVPRRRPNPNADLTAQLTDATREFLLDQLPLLRDEILVLLRTATKDDAPRITLLNKLLDKILPDLRATDAARGPTQPINIQINNVNRGTRAATPAPAPEPTQP